jgi:hypothetical protein
MNTLEQAIEAAKDFNNISPTVVLDVKIIERIYKGNITKCNSDIANLLVLLRNECKCYPLQTILYIKTIFALSLSEARIIYQDFTILPTDTQTQF